MRGCYRCGSTEGLQRHHVIPKALNRQVLAEAPDYWNLWASVKADWDTMPSKVVAEFREAAARWAELPHRRIPLCRKCGLEVHQEIRVLLRRVRQGHQHIQCTAECDFLECESWRQFDLGNLFAWFVPDSPLIKIELKARG